MLLYTGHDRMASYSDTTSATGSLLLYHLATNQDKQAILHTEIRQDKSIPADDMRQYHYIGVAPAA